MVTCCASRCAADEYFGGAIAERDLQRYRQKGPDRETRLFLERLLDRFLVKGCRSTTV
jgi:hypothetical protein